MKFLLEASSKLLTRYPQLSRLRLPLLVIASGVAIFLAGRATGEFLYFVTHP
ncbi:hypothetical protein [Deinococcus aquaedulcis]|uniref:hypothetical protein n=1 Tax=Deinococcus aquaedulcis TaxID=2840455 RepID=UPI001C832A93|nr:hypothetical protein [Deinococcus aquaedulcis]